VGKLDLSRWVARRKSGCAQGFGELVNEKSVSRGGKTIDAICALGCTVVSGYILALQKGELRPEYQSLDEIQRASLLQELQSIMSVYEGKCR